MMSRDGGVEGWVEIHTEVVYIKRGRIGKITNNEYVTLRNRNEFVVCMLL